MRRVQSSLGECLGHIIKDGRHVLIPIQAYFDGSHSGGKGWVDGSLATLAGCAADDGVWAKFDNDWRGILEDDRERPRAAYLHMNESNSLEGEFHWKKGWNRKKVESLWADIFGYLRTVDEKLFHQFACTIDLDAYRKISGEGYLLPEPIDLCNECCPEQVLNWYSSTYPGIISEAHYFFDQSEPFEDPFREVWKKRKSMTLDPNGLDYFWSLIKTVTAADMRERPPLQAADILAWAINRNLSAEEGKVVYAKDLDRLLKYTMPSIWVLWNEENLRKIYCDPDSAKFQKPGSKKVYDSSQF